MEQGFIPCGARELEGEALIKIKRRDNMTEEQKLKQAPGCGSFIMFGLVIIVLLSLAGLVFPVDILPYPNEILIGVLAISAIALIIAFFMRRSRVRDKQKEEDDKADNLLRQGFETLGDIDDEARKLAKKYEDGE